METITYTISDVFIGIAIFMHLIGLISISRGLKRRTKELETQVIRVSATLVKHEKVKMNINPYRKQTVNLPVWEYELDGSMKTYRGIRATTKPVGHVTSLVVVKDDDGILTREDSAGGELVAYGLGIFYIILAIIPLLIAVVID